MGTRMEFRDLLVKTHFGEKTNEAQKNYMTQQSHTASGRLSYYIICYTAYQTPYTIYYILLYLNGH